jgi:predicted PurR-regulated permease PerM
VPYLGAAAMITLLAVVAVATLDGVGHILAVPATYFVMTTINNSAVAPIAYGRRLSLNPLAVLIGVLYWWFIWGVPGAFMAVPLIAVIRTICEHIDSLRAPAELLGE